MARTPVVIEINNYEVKGLAFRSGIAGRSFFQAETMLLNPKESIPAQVAAFVAERYAGAIGVYFNVPYESLITRELSFPFADRRKVREVLPFELEPLIPYDLQEIVYDSYLTTNHTNQTTRAIIAGSRKDTLIRFLDEFRQRQVTVLGIYTPHDALYRLHPFTGLESCIMLHVSRMVSIIVIVLSGEWRFARVMPVGYDWLIARLKSKWKSDTANIHRILLALPASLEPSADLEAFKKAHKVGKERFKALQDAIRDFTQVISRELEVSLRNLQIDQEGDAVQANAEQENADSKPLNPAELPVALSSDLNNAMVIENALAQGLNHEVVPFPYERTPLALLDREHLVTMGGAYSQTVSGKMNLLKDELRKWVVSSQAGASRTALALAATAVIVFGLSFFIDLRRRSQQLKEWEDRQVKVFQQFFPGMQLPDNVSALSYAAELVRKEKQKTEIIEVFLKAPRLSAILVQLHQNISTEAGLEINSFYYNDRGIEINGIVPDFAKLEDIKRSLSKASLLTGVESKNENSTPGPGGQNRIKFTLFCKVKKTEGSTQ
jgi:type II secretory pathway component PulL